MNRHAFGAIIIFAMMTAAAHGQDAVAEDIMPDSSNINTDIASSADDITPDSSDTGENGAADADDAMPDPPDAELAGDTLPKPPVAAPPLLAGRYYGIGAGLSLGTTPLFEMWGRALPDSLSRLGLSPDFGRDPEIKDTLPFRYSIVEAYEAFNIFVPFCASLHSIWGSGSAAVALSFFYNAKQFQSTLYPGSASLTDPGAADRRIDIFEMMRFYSLTLEASYNAVIPPEYFSINGSRQTFLSFTAGASPLQFFSRSCGVRVHAHENDARMQEAADSVRSRLSDFTANGAAVSWRTGVTAIMGREGGSGIELGLYYGGTYSGWFRKDGEKVMKSKVHTGAEETDKPLYFISNRIEFKATVLKAAKPK